MVKLVPFGLFIWFPVVFLLFKRLPKHRAVIASFLLGMLFLPEVRDPIINPEAPAAVPVPLVPLTKQNTICLSIILAALLFDGERLLAFRPRWFDVPMIIWCICPFLSSAANEPPPDGTNPYWDGFSQARAQTLAWGVPYFIGRVYFSEWGRFRELLVGVVIGGILYMPFVLFECRMSPQLHKHLYGFYQHDPSQSVKDGGFRPTVFMEHGLGVAMMMVAAGLIGFWMWWSKAFTQLRIRQDAPPIPVIAPIALIFVTVGLMHSSGALALGILGVLMLFVSRYLNARLAMFALLLLPPLYIFGRTLAGQEPVGWTSQRWHKIDDDEGGELDILKARALAKPMFSWGNWSSQDFIDLLTRLFNEDRASSYKFRLVNEDRLMEKSRMKPILGWAGWDRVLIFMDNYEGEDPPKVLLTVVDGMWIITLGNRGWVGLIAVYVAMLLPVVRFLILHPQRHWGDPVYAPAAAVAILLLLHMIDNLSNAMFNPCFVLLAGSLSGVVGTSVQANIRQEAPAAPARPPQRALANPRPGVLVRSRPAGR
jgi:hypothetical protein